MIFSARRRLGHANTNETITYNDVSINIGEGMNGSTGTFTVPVSGLYAFSFSALTAEADPSTDIEVYQNDEDQFRIVDHNKNEQKNMSNIGYSWYMRLEQNDKVYLKVISNVLICTKSSLVWFNGHLLKAL